MAISDKVLLSNIAIVLCRGRFPSENFKYLLYIGYTPNSQTKCSKVLLPVIIS